MGKKKPILESIADTGSSVKKMGSQSDIGLIDWMKKKVVVRIHYPSSQCKEYNIKVTHHTFDIEGQSYFIHGDGFYKKNKVWYCDYFFGNPNPISYKHEFRGVLVPSRKLKKDLIKGKYKDQENKQIDYERWEKLPYEDKVRFPDVIEFDARMLNRVLNHKFTDHLFESGSLLSSAGKKIALWIFIILGVVVAIIIGLAKTGVFDKMGGG